MFLGVVFIASAAVIAPAGAQHGPTGARSPVTGQLSLSVHTHSSGFGSPSGAPTLFSTDPLEIPVASSPFSYSAIPCSSPAPFNDRALSFSPGYPGLGSGPLAVRHLVRGDVTTTTRSGDRGIVEGTITTFLCQNGQEQDRVQFRFVGRFQVTSANEAVVAGSFRIVGGRGRFAGLTGGGTITGRFTCLPPVLARAGATDCADLGAFSDSVLMLQGSFANQDAGAAT